MQNKIYVAGNYLDALIAEKVMGWKFNPDFESLTFQDENHTDLIVPNYSTQIGDAWQIIEKFKWAEPELSYSDDCHEGWILRLNKLPLDYYSLSETPALAICRTAIIVATNRFVQAMVSKDTDPDGRWDLRYKEMMNNGEIV